MLDTLQRVWRARHVLVLAEARTARWLLAALEELGAHAERLDPDADARALSRAMTAARVSALAVPRAQELGVPGEDASGRLARLETLLDEAREAGVPLTLLATDVPVYRGCARPPREDDPLGGETREGLIQSLFSLYADGAARGLLGGAVRTLLIRHAPALDGGAPSVAQYARWCDALLDGDVVPVEAPAAQGAFAHPAEIACGSLLLAASCLERAQAGVFNLGLAPRCLCANLTAARRLVAAFGGSRPIRTLEPAVSRPAAPPDGSAALSLCGAQCRLPADEALGMLLALRRAEREGEAAARAQTRAQIRSVLLGCQ